MKARSQGKTDINSGGQEGFFWSGERAGSWERASSSGCAAHGVRPRGEHPNVCWHQHNMTDPPNM